MGKSARPHMGRASGEDFSQQTAPLATCVASGREKGEGVLMLERKRWSGARGGKLLRKTNRKRAGLPPSPKRRSSAVAALPPVLHAFCEFFRSLGTRAL